MNPTPCAHREIKDVHTGLYICAYKLRQEWDRREQEFQQREQEFQKKGQEFQQREQEYQFRELESQRVLVVTSQELADTRACLMHLDATLDEQVNALQVAPTSS